MALLQITDLRAGYGSAGVLHGVSFGVREGELAVLLGANGVGKTTTLNAIAGLLRPWSGSITFDGRPIDRMNAERVVRLGLGMVPGPPGIFRELSVVDNLRVGGFAVGSRTVEHHVDRVLGTFPILRERARQTAGSLSGGEQRMLAMARALMGEPRLLLVDEASMGLSPAMTSNVLRLLDEVRRDGVTILMAEQNVAALAIADRAFVMEKGVIVREDEGSALAQTRAEVARAYLGTTTQALAGGKR